MEAPSFETLLYDVDAEGVLTLTVNRPDKLNALTTRVLSELNAAMRRARQDGAVRGIVLTGAGDKAFVAGADISQFPELEPMDAHRFALRGQAVFSAIEQMAKPVVAAVNGFALGGGCELALACHLRVASERAQFGLPEVGLGLIPGYGGTQRLPRVVGLGVATELVLTGDRVTAQRAYEVGLVNRVVAPEALLDEAKALVQRITSKAPLAVAMAMQALRASEQPLQQGLQMEAALFGQCASTEDFAEGVGAFLNRGKPDFTGR